MSAALLRRGLELLGAPEAPGAAPGHTKPSQAPMKRTRKAKATQAQKLRNSAKGKALLDYLPCDGRGAGSWEHGDERITSSRPSRGSHRPGESLSSSHASMPPCLLRAPRDLPPPASNPQNSA
ncbi:active regulator of SIRT1 isoform X3 [Bubalus kerabau]|uniref:active regulator of SIRT1 isoform X3 n=1 Tax=Bubalus carabanensis TaxID=3119969 RepID=UPI00244E6F1E|nr:active regulator of SIRT1 isoform X3 [Bubalus carabanensis]